MKKIILVALVLLSTITTAQTEKLANRLVFDNFIQNYNNDQYTAIFEMFSTEMKAALPVEKATEFLAGLKSQSGAIQKFDFVKYENGTFALYKTEFERATLNVYVSVNDQYLINGFLIKPFTPESASKEAFNNLPTAGKIITKKQSEIIFENAIIFPNQTQIAIAIIENGKAKFYGIKRVNDTISTKVNSKSIFEIGSISKVFTSTLLANSVLNKQIKLSDNINQYLKFPLKGDVKLSFKDLANHTSGLPSLPSNLDVNANPENPYKNYSEDDLQNYLTKSLDSIQILKGKYQYSNLGAGLLGYTLTIINGKSYENLLQDLIFSKYNMPNSTTKKDQLKEVLVKGLNENGKEVPNWDLSVLVGAGGILSNVEDLSKFAIAQFDTRNTELELTRQRTFAINDDMEIALGWHMVESENMDKWLWHNGGTGGYSSSMAVDVKHKNAVIVLSNITAFHPNHENIDNLCFDLMETLSKK